MQTFLFWEKAKSRSRWRMVQKISSLMFSMLLIHHNLLSMGQLSKKGFNMKIHEGYCMLIDKNGRFVAKVKMTPNHLFPLKIHHEKLSCLSSFVPNDDWLWHMCFGNFHFSELNYLSRKELVSSFLL